MAWLVGTSLTSKPFLLADDQVVFDTEQFVRPFRSSITSDQYPTVGFRGVSNECVIHRPSNDDVLVEQPQQLLVLLR